MIQPGTRGSISFCGNATYKLGIEGKLDIYNSDDGRIATLNWYGPWPRFGNRFELTNMNSQKYLIFISPVHQNGVLGEITLAVNKICSLSE